jgi:uncharacterized protein (TIRG00374 family)
MNEPPPEPVETLDDATFRRAWSSLGKRLLLPGLLGLAAFLGLAFYADARELADRLGDFDLGLLGPLLGLSLINYFLRFVRWQMYLSRVGLVLPWGRSLGVFLVGFPLSVTPGKLGELGKAWLVRELGGGPARNAVAVVLAERLTDLVAVFALACLGSSAFPALRGVAWAGLALCMAGVALLAWPRFLKWALNLLERVPALAGRLAVLLEVQVQLRRLLAPGTLMTAVLLGMVAWGAEGLGFALVVRGYTPDASWLAGVFNYSLGSLVGGMTMLPGGLVATEGALAGLLGAQGLDAATAASVTLIVRAATLWFAVLLGLAAMPVVWRQVRSTER